MNRWTVLFATVLVSVLITVSCSSGSGSPVMPSVDSGITGMVNHSAQTQTHLWGYYDVFIDVENRAVEAVLNRSAMFSVNVVTFMNINPGNFHTSIYELSVSTDYVDIDIDVTIVHPFPDMPEYNGYDVRGIFCSDGSGTLEYNSDLHYPVFGTDQIMLDDPEASGVAPAEDYLGGGPDGYTRWFNPVEFLASGIFSYTPGAFASTGFSGDATLNPYKYFADGLGAEQDLWSFLNSTTGNGVFSTDEKNTRNYYLRFPKEKGLQYGYAIVANWEGKAEECHPANAPEAVGLSVDVTDNIYYVDEFNKGGNLILDIHVPGWEYQPSTIFIESEVLGAGAVEIPSMLPTGGDDTFSTYHCDLPATVLTSSADSEFWVICQYDGFDYTNDFGKPNAADTDFLAAFFRFDLHISDESVCTVTGIDFNPPNGVTDPGPNPYTGIEIYGDGFEGSTTVVEFLGVTNIVATNVVVSGADTITCDVDFTGTAPGDLYDIYVENVCGKNVTVEDFVQVTALSYFEIIGPHMYYDGIGPYESGCVQGIDNPVPTEWDIDFDASGSEGATVFDWDLDGDGIYEGTGGPLYTANFPAGTAPGTYYPVLRVNGNDNLTYTSPTGIVVATGLYVRDNDLEGDPAGPGDRANPFDTAHSAMGTVTGGEIVMVFGGEAEQIDYGTNTLWGISVNDIHLQGYQGSTGEPPIYDDQNWHDATWLTVTGSNVTIDGFEFHNFRRVKHAGTQPHSEYLIRITGDNCTVSHCYFHTFGDKWKGGRVVYFHGSDTDLLDGATVCNCLAYDGDQWWDWGTNTAFQATYVNDAKMINNTVDRFMDGTGWVSNPNGFMITAPGTNPDIRNNIATRFQSGYASFGHSCGMFQDSSVITAYYCDAWSAGGSAHRYLNCGEDVTCLDLDPLYVDTEADHHLQTGSPCADTGDPDIQDFDGSPSDMGCYGGPGGDWNFED